MATAAPSNRGVNGSLSKPTPPSAASTGTLSWITAALVAGSRGSTEYQTTYPIFFFNDTETTEIYTPATVGDDPASSTRLSNPAKGTVRRKLPAVAATASPAPRPRNE